MRLCAASGARLHLIEPLGFTLSDKKLQRAGMDYRERADYYRHLHWQDCQTWLQNNPLEGAQKRSTTIFALTTKATTSYTSAKFQRGDTFLFGAETRGLPPELLNRFDEAHRLRIPMKAGERSLNLAMSVAVVLYEALRQNDFQGN